MDTSTEEYDNKFFKERILSPNSLKNTVYQKLKEKRIYYKNLDDLKVDNPYYDDNIKVNKFDISRLSDNDPEKKLKKFHLNDYNMIGFLKEKYDKYDNIYFAEEKITNNFNDHIKQACEVKRKKLRHLLNINLGIN